MAVTTSILNTSPYACLCLFHIHSRSVAFLPPIFAFFPSSRPRYSCFESAALPSCRLRPIPRSGEMNAPATASLRRCCRGINSLLRPSRPKTYRFRPLFTTTMDATLYKEFTTRGLNYHCCISPSCSWIETHTSLLPRISFYLA